MAKYTSNKYGGAGIGGSIDVEGLEKVKRIMKDSMQDAKKRRTLLKALRHGAIPTRKAMKIGTPIKTGNLKSSIATITGKSGMDGISATSVTVGAKVQKKTRYGFAKKIKNDGYYIGWVVKGHKKRGGGETKANDFITPAFNSTKDIATKRIVDKLVRDVLEKNWK
tara:strand:- start:4096 stop:4593 length:498 start_codon:yes stop_codon:yes gene_type:complete